MSVVQDTASSPFRPLRNGLRHAALSAALILAIAACGGDKADPAVAAQPEATVAQPAQTTAPVISAQIAAMSVDQLREAARAAQGEQRMYAPAGNNAMEYYLALRDKDFKPTVPIYDLPPPAPPAATPTPR